ncbi:tetratricopeptide repeat protein [Candidatus Peregrinibacteria bacterium]|nr:MAG: tetratricopeptide repeat protein [Candidatus Peregrinibacteria bacterium]
MKIRSILIALVALMLLTACNAEWQKPVNLTPEEKTALEKQIITNRTTLESGALEGISEDTEEALFYWIEIARAYESLGNLKKAAKTYEEARKIYPRSEAIEVNLANVYQQAQLADKAIAQYLNVVEMFHSTKYYNQVAWVYAEQKRDLKKAEFYVTEWQKMAEEPILV